MREASFVSKVWGVGEESVDPTVSSAELPKADMGDAADFHRWLQDSPHDSEGHSSALGNILRTATSSLHEHERAFEHSLHRTARTGNPMDGLAVQKHMSELYLSHGLAVKVISKSTQALETLMRMQ